MSRGTCVHARTYAHATHVHMNVGYHRTGWLDFAVATCSLPLSKADFSAIKSRRNTRLLSERASPPGKCDPRKISSENLGSPELRSPRCFLRVCTRVCERWTHDAISVYHLPRSSFSFFFGDDARTKHYFRECDRFETPDKKKTRDALPQVFTRANYRRCTRCVTIILLIICRREFLKCRILPHNFALHKVFL